MKVLIAIGFWFAFILAGVAGWLTHIVYCFQHHAWLLLLVGAIAAPLGTVHGWGLWFGWWA